MQKLYINGRFLSQKITGVQRVARELVIEVDKLLENNVETSVYIIAPSNALDIPDFKNIKVIRTKLKGQLWEQTILPLYTVGGMLINLCNTAPLLKFKQQLLIHDTAVYAFPLNFDLKFRLWYKFSYFWLTKIGVKLKTISTFSKLQINNYLKAPIDSIGIITEGCDHINRVEADNQIVITHGLKDRSYVLAVSSLTPNKNFKAITDAIKLIDKPQFDIVIAGGVNPVVFSASSSELPKEVKYLGYVTDEELKALYLNATCFVFPSIYEGFGLPPLEAMACGCPVLASNKASIPEVCGDAACYFDPFSALDLKEKLLKVMSSEELRVDMIERGKKQAKKFSWSQGAAELIASF